MMKRFPALLILLLLVGCAAQAKPAETVAFTQHSPCAASLGLYDPNSSMEAQTGGALRCYPLKGAQCSGIRSVESGLILFTIAENTTQLTKLTGDTALAEASLELPFVLEAQDATIHPWEKGLSFYDPIAAETILVNAQLEIEGSIPAPEDLLGSPILSRDGKTLYYCTDTAIRAWNLETGISRVLKQSAYPTQFVSGLIMEERVLQCTIADGVSTEMLFICVETGSTLYAGDGVEKIVTSSSAYYAAMREGSDLLWLFGSETGPSQELLFPDPETTGYFLPELHSAIGLTPSGSDTILMDLYDLHTGLRTGSVYLESLRQPRSFQSCRDGSVWFVGWDSGYGCDALYRWDHSRSQATDSHSHIFLHFTRENPDTDGLAVCFAYARELEQRFGIEILIYQEADDFQPENCQLIYEHRVPVLHRELQRLEQSLGYYPEGFLHTLAASFDGLTICLLRSLSPSGTDIFPGCNGGIQFWNQHHAYIALAAGQKSDQALYHQLCHLIDTVVLSKSSAYDTWNSLNPSGFQYDYDYRANLHRNSTAYLQDATRYFADMFSMSYPKEDRARIMEHAMTDGNEALFSSHAMQAKLRAICIGIREAFGLQEYGRPLLWEQYLQKPISNNLTVR